MNSAFIGRAALPRKANVEVRRPGSQRGRFPSVSVIIPCYNYGHYLPGCVSTVLGQEAVRVDVLVIDDASPDESARVARQLADQDDRVRVICHAENHGHIATYNEGLDQASGDYTVLLSADDLLTPGCLERATSLMEEYPSVGITYGFPVEFMDTDVPPARTARANWIIWQGHDWIAQVCKTGRSLVLSPEVVMRTSLIREIGGFRADHPHAADVEMWLRAATVSDIGYVAGADQAYYRHHSGNMHQAYDKLTDMSERLRAFDTVFAERAGLLANASMLRETAHRAVAREALDRAIMAYVHSAADREPVDEYIAFASTTWPDMKRLREWRSLSRLRSSGDSRLRRDALLIQDAVRLKLKYSMRWRRWRLFGV
jgi:GT2 family glycosyltransferase